MINKATLGTVTIDYHVERECRSDKSAYDDQHVHIKFAGEDFFYRNNELITLHSEKTIRRMIVEVNMHFHRMAPYAQNELPPPIQEALEDADILMATPDELMREIGILARDDVRYALMPRYDLGPLSRSLPEYDLLKQQSRYTGARGDNATS
jgi:hypothetical protein